MTGTIFYILSFLLNLGFIPVAILTYKKKLTFTQGLFTGAVLFLASYMCNVYSINITNDVSFIDAYINNFFNEMSNFYTTQQGIALEQAALMNKILDMAKNAYFMALPAILVCTNLVMSYVLLMIFKGAMALIKKDVSNFKKFSELKMPKQSIYVGLISLVLSNIIGDSRFGYVFLNVALVIAFATMMCGLSVIDFKLRTKFKNALSRFFIYLAVILFFGTVVIYGFWAFIIVGIIDAFSDLRKPRIKIDKTNQ